MKDLYLITYKPKNDTSHYMFSMHEQSSAVALALFIEMKAEWIGKKGFYGITIRKIDMSNDNDVRTVNLSERLGG